MRKKKVIFTAIVGNYDHVYQPVVDDSFDYVLFSNDLTETQIGVWQIRKIPYENEDNTRVARWVKTHPHLLLANYDYSVWIDSNVIIASKDAYKLFDNLYNRGIAVSSFAHPHRDCIYDECLQVGRTNIDKFHNMIPEILEIKEAQYPPHNGLCETNCIYRNQNNPELLKLNEEWWSMIEKYSKRDQLAFNFFIWKHNIGFEYLLGLGYCARNHHYFKMERHAVKRGCGSWPNFIKKIAYKVYPPVYYCMLKSDSKSFILHLNVRIIMIIENALNSSASFIKYVRLK